MKSLLLMLSILLSASAWAGPDIPWPHSSDAPSEKEQDKDDGQEFVGVIADTHGENHFFAIAIEKNQTGLHSQCPYVVVIREIDPVSGEVLYEHQSLQCKPTIEPIEIRTAGFKLPKPTYFDAGMVQL